MSVLEELKKKISDIETQSLAMDGCRPTFTVNEIMDLIDSVESDKQTEKSAQPDEKLRKIADLVEGTIDHFDRDDAMDLLYQIKEIVGNETSNIRG